MPFKSEFAMTNDFLRVKTTGTLASVQEVEQYVDAIRTEALKQQTKKVLLDERELWDKQDTHDAYRFSESDVVTLTALAGIRISGISHPDNYELNKTYETLLMNRSLIFKVFLYEDDALEWLLNT